MDTTTTEAHIRELESVRKQINLWRGGAVGIVFVAILICVGTLYSDVKTLAQQGPGQEQFVQELQAGLNERVVPSLREEAGRTVTEMQPVVQAEFLKLNTRVPELTQASLQQIDLLQQSLPKKAADALNETFDAAIKQQEPEIRKMFPDVTEDQVKGLVENMTKVVNERGPDVANELLSSHITAIQNIHTNLVKIQEGDRSAATMRGDDWEMALAVFDVVRDDVKDLKLPNKEAAKMIADAAGKVSNAAEHVADTANKVSGTAKDIAKQATEKGKEGN